MARPGRARRATVQSAHGARTRQAGCPVARRRRGRGRRLRPNAQERTAPARVGGEQRGAAARGRPRAVAHSLFPTPARWLGAGAVPSPSGGRWK
ncbi:hypothetical protein NN561_013676 [Cricetulus griseus]